MNDRLKSSFANPAALTDQDHADMTAAVNKNASTAAKRRNRLQNAGGSNGKETARNEAARQRRADLHCLPRYEHDEWAERCRTQQAELSYSPTLGQIPG